MKKIFSIFVLLILSISISTSVFAQKPKSKDELFKEIATLSNTKKPEDTEKAYQLSKEFLTRFPKDKNAEKLRPFVKEYRQFVLFANALADKKYADFFTIGKEILTDEPENVAVTLGLGYGGYAALLNSNDKSFSEDALKYAQSSLQLMEKGIFPASFAPFNSKDDALAWMYYIIGNFAMEKDIKLAATSFYKATLYESAIKNSPQPYDGIAQYYEKRYETMSKDLNAKAKTLSDAEFKAENDKVNVIIEQMMDAYARAYKIASAANSPTKDQYKTRLAAVYKFYKKTDAGFEPFLSYVVTTPFKDPANF